MHLRDHPGSGRGVPDSLSRNALGRRQRVESERDDRRLGQLAVVRQQRSQVASGAVLGYNPQVALRVVPAVEGQNVAVPQLAQCAHLVEQFGLARLVYLAQGHKLDAQALACLVHPGMRARADLFILTAAPRAGSTKQCEGPDAARGASGTGHAGTESRCEHVRKRSTGLHATPP
eukprot:scaffold21487_cov105-Isochrysis_galbana.AAC.12